MSKRQIQESAYGRRMSNDLPAGSRGRNANSNPANEGQLQELSSVELPFKIYKGIVIESYAGSYTCRVRILEGRDGIYEIQAIVPFSMSSSHSGSGMQVSSMPPEGSMVLIMQMEEYDVKSSIILCVLPGVYSSDMSASGSVLIPQNIFEGGVSPLTESVWKDRFSGDPSAIPSLAGDGRAVDIAPGTVVDSGPLGVKHVKSMWFQKLAASEQCLVEMFVLNDLLRMVSGHFQHFSPTGERHIYNDGGYLTDETIAASNQCELHGLLSYGDWLKEDEFDPEKATSTVRKLIEDNQRMHKRYMRHIGHTGGMINTIVSQPDPSVAVNTAESGNRDRGTFGMHVGHSGRTMIRSAGDFIIQRTDRIAVPKKKSSAEDPSGEQVDEKDPYEIKKPFDWGDDEFPGVRSLKLSDAMAWYDAGVYQRYDEASGDWYTPEDEELEIPDDDVNTDGRTLDRENYSEYDGKKGVIAMGMDGSLVLRAQGGSEIVLSSDGNIQINAPGDIRMKSGGNLVGLGGRDTVIKGRKSVDVSATEKDVRVKAENNLHMVSEGGVLVESKSESEGGAWSDREGEDVSHGGIILKAAKSSIVQYADKLHLSAVGTIIMEAKEKLGDIVMAARQFTGTFKRFLTTTPGGSGLDMGTTTSIFGSSVTMAAENVGIYKGTQGLSPVFWVDMHDDVYGRMREQSDSINERYYNESEWLKPFDYRNDGRKEVGFTFRTSEQYGTDSEKFAVYEPYCIFEFDRDEKSLQKWTENGINDTYPWPGRKHYEGGKSLKRLGKEINTTANGLKKRKQRKPVGGEIVSVDMGEYRVPEQQKGKQ